MFMLHERCIWPLCAFPRCLICLMKSVDPSCPSLLDKSNFLSGHLKAGFKVEKLAMWSINTHPAASSIRGLWTLSLQRAYCTSGQDISPPILHLNRLVLRRKQHSFIFLFNLFQSVIIFRTVLVECVMHKRSAVPTRSL